MAEEINVTLRKETSRQREERLSHEERLATYRAYVDERTKTEDVPFGDYILTLGTGTEAWHQLAPRMRGVTTYQCPDGTRHVERTLSDHIARLPDQTRAEVALAYLKLKSPAQKKLLGHLIDATGILGKNIRADLVIARTNTGDTKTFSITPNKNSERILWEKYAISMKQVGETQ